MVRDALSRRPSGERVVAPYVLAHAPHCGQILGLFGADVVLIETDASRALRGDVAAPEIERVLQHEDAVQRAGAALAAGRLEDEHAIDLLLRATHDAHPRVAGIAIEAMAGRKKEDYQLSGLTFDEILPGNYEGAAHLADMGVEHFQANRFYVSASLAARVRRFAPTSTVNTFPSTAGLPSASQRARRRCPRESRDCRRSRPS